MRLWTIASIFVLCLVLTVRAEMTQSLKARYIREAQRLKELGKTELALEKITTVYRQSSDDWQVVKAMSEILLASGKERQAVRVIEDYVRANPQDVSAMGYLASLYFEIGDTEKAWAVNSKIVRSAPQSGYGYIVVYTNLVRAGMYDEAIELVRQARKELGDSTFLFKELGEIYRLKGLHAAAAREILIAFSRGKVSQGEAYGMITGLCTDSVDTTLRDTLIRWKTGSTAALARRCLLELYLSDGNCLEASELLEEIAANDTLTLNLCVSVGRKLREKGCYGECARAYELGATLTPDNASPEILIEVAECLELNGEIDRATQAYQLVCKKFPKSKYAYASYLALARICVDAHDYERAIEFAQKASSMRLRGSEEAILLWGDILVLMGDLDGAAGIYDRVRTYWQDKYAQEAYFNLGEICFFQGRWDDAISYYDLVSHKFPEEERANDAIERLVLIKSSKRGEGYSRHLKQFANAVLLKRQSKLTEAQRLLQQILGSDVTELKIEALKLLSEIYIDQKNYEGAFKIYRYASDSLETYWSPTALEKAGDLYLKLGMVDEAIQTYEDLVLRYPQTVQAGEARQKLEIAKKAESR